MNKFQLCAKIRSFKNCSLFKSEPQSMWFQQQKLQFVKRISPTNTSCYSSKQILNPRIESINYGKNLSNAITELCCNVVSVKGHIESLQKGLKTFRWWGYKQDGLVNRTQQNSQFYSIRLRTEVRSHFNIHGTKYFQDSVFHQIKKNMMLLVS